MVMDDASLLALCAFQEANLEPDDGLAAVARVVLNRIARRYQSNGTMFDTITHGDGCAFSWVGFDMVNGHYIRVADGPDEIEARVARLLEGARAYAHAWERAQTITGAVRAGTYHGPDYDKLTDDVVLYINPSISHAAWAVPANEVCAIGRHTFYHA
jgi:spore germination cell wall hydrolase CwlJ-like protein